MGILQKVSRFASSPQGRSAINSAMGGRSGRSGTTRRTGTARRTGTSRGTAGGGGGGMVGRLAQSFMGGGRRRM